MVRGTEETQREEQVDKGKRGHEKGEGKEEGI